MTEDNDESLPGIIFVIALERPVVRSVARRPWGFEVEFAKISESAARLLLAEGRSSSRVRGVAEKARWIGCLGGWRSFVLHVLHVLHIEGLNRREMTSRGMAGGCN
jgi:hypothetical protein